MGHPGSELLNHSPLRSLPGDQAAGETASLGWSQSANVIPVEGIVQLSSACGAPTLASSIVLGSSAHLVSFLWKSRPGPPPQPFTQRALLAVCKPAPQLVQIPRALLQ
ncbi:hypothetical protein KIL84_020752 [Mauremys mutica]|uniref:Uncharacterized protein n=1 Tax=Mauremys mutica TaxID=74926 RepID=A0A9D3XAX5_9SAUR|nr:hypothetical protein KIL84_020752 [Mauremys mutica]